MTDLASPATYLITLFTLLACWLVGTSAAKLGLVGVQDGRGRIGCIDGLRGYLALGVLAHHFSVWIGIQAGRPWSAPPDLVFNNLGQAGVAVFFMITGALFYARLTNGGPRVDWLSFYVGRIFRLTPLLWTAVLLVNIVILSRIGWTIPGSLGDYGLRLARWLTFTGTPDLAGYRNSYDLVARVTWSLVYEWGFYLGLPFLAVALSVAAKAKLPRLVLPLALLLVTALGVGTIVYKINLALPALFVIGMLAIEASRNERLAAILRTPSFAAIGLVALMTELAFFGTSFELPQYALLALFFFPVVAGNTYFGILSNPGSIVLGEISYSIYLLHGLVLNVLFVDVLAAGPAQAGGWAMWLLMPAAGVLAVLLALTTFRLVEQPGVRVGRALARGLSARRTARLAPNRPVAIARD